MLLKTLLKTLLIIRRKIYIHESPQIDCMGNEMVYKEDYIKKEIKKEDSIKKEEKNEEKRKRKVRQHIYIDKELLEEFKRFCIIKHGKYEWGLYSQEIELALRHWMSLHSFAHSKSELDIKVPSLSKNPPSRVQLVYNMVKEYLWQEYQIDVLETDFIPIQFVERAIKVIRGTDPRTVKKWINAMKEFGLIKVRGKLVEFVA